MDTMHTKAAFKIGDRVIARAWDGRRRVVVIEDIGDKDGRIVYDLSDGHWAYADQLERA